MVLSTTWSTKTKNIASKNTVFLPNFLVSKFCGKAQLPFSLGKIPRNSAKTIPFHKFSIGKMVTLLNLLKKLNILLAAIVPIVLILMILIK